jgi:hypothetical protein
MSPLRIVFQFLFEIACIPLAVVGVPIVVLFAKWDDYETDFSGGCAPNGPPAIRGDLPKWAAWFGTFDERLPGGMYEPSVARVYQKYGRYVCSLYWLIVRNRMFGLMKFLFGKPAERHEQSEFVMHEVGPFLIGWGTKVYRATPTAHWRDGPFVRCPSVTIRLNR